MDYAGLGTSLLAVVAGDIDGYRTVVTNDVNGLLVPPGDAVSLSAALVRVTRDREYAARLVAAATERAEEMSMSKLAQRYVQIYRDVLQAEAEERIVVRPSAAVRYFEERLLRRPRLARFSQNVVDTVSDTVADTVAVLRDKSQQLRERVSGDKNDDE
ncbi:MAG: hypothetical protein EBV02_05925 [Actinobacteria bacterium]|nr:hypothetical protein [Actinomycetota bacterium]